MTSIRDAINIVEAAGRASLAQRIRAFVATYAKIAGSYDPDFDPPEERFNGPDPGMLEAAADALEAGQVPDRVHSDFGSGCYRGWPDAAIQAEHDALVSAVNGLANAQP